MKDNTFVIVGVSQTITMLIITAITSTNDTILAFLGVILPNQRIKCHMTVTDQNVQNGTPSTVDGLATSTTSDNSIHPDMNFHTGCISFYL